MAGGCSSVTALAYPAHVCNAEKWYLRGASKLARCMVACDRYNLQCFSVYLSVPKWRTDVDICTTRNTLFRVRFSVPYVARLSTEVFLCLKRCLSILSYRYNFSRSTDINALPTNICCAVKMVASFDNALYQQGGIRYALTDIKAVSSCQRISKRLNGWWRYVSSLSDQIVLSTGVCRKCYEEKQKCWRGLS